MLETLSLGATEYTPEINFDAENGMLEMSGSSLPENSFIFFAPIFEWLDKYAQSPQPLTKLILKLDYLNSSSSKKLADILFRLEEIHAKGNKVEAEWHHFEEDDIMEEKGTQLQGMLKFPMELKEMEG